MRLVEICHEANKDYVILEHIYKVSSVKPFNNEWFFHIWFVGIPSAHSFYYSSQEKALEAHSNLLNEFDIKEYGPIP